MKQTSAVKVSVSLHTQEPDLDGNQRQHECEYMNYNRQHTILGIFEDGHGEFSCDKMPFPANGENVVSVATHFSIGVAVAPGNQGGAIIIAGPLNPPIVATQGLNFVLDASGGVYKERLDVMRSDGRFFDSVEADHERGLNIPD